jgi:hypothetical protein
MTWEQIPCTGAPSTAVGHPAPKRPDYALGNGDVTERQAQVSGGHISSVVGSFPRAINVRSEGDDPNSTSNDFSVQLNSNVFTSPLCSGATTPSSCHAWQQFVYSDGAVWMQYWLIGYGNPNCPSGWSPDSGDCVLNSVAGLEIPVRGATVLDEFSMIGTAGSDTDTFQVITGDGEVYLVSEPSHAALNQSWTASEFNVVGNCCGARAFFNSGATLLVQQEVSTTPALARVHCVTGGTTGETLNMNVYGPCVAQNSGAYHAVRFHESNAAATATTIKNDFNGDGMEDAVIVTPTGSWEYTGIQKGSFTPDVWVRRDLTLGGVDYTTGDFNGDGIADAIIVTPTGSWEYLGLASGGFTPNVWVRHDLPLGAVKYTPGDFNGDGLTDVIITTAGGSFEYLGLAAGGFTPNVWVRYDLPLGAAQYTTGDFNGDDVTDAIITTSTGSWEYTGLRSGGFTANVWVDHTMTLGNVAFTAGDFNGDMMTDLVIAMSYGSFEYLGSGSGFASRVPWLRYDLPLGTVDYYAGDYDNDGLTDLLIVNGNGSWEYTGLGAGGFTENVWVRRDLPRGTVNYKVGDFTGDLKDDLLITNSGGSSEYAGASGGFTVMPWTRSDLPLGQVAYY